MLHASLPGAAVSIAFKNYLKNVEIHIPSRSSYTLLRDNTPGGQSLLFTLQAIAGVTPIREAEFGSSAEVCQSIFSLE